MRETWYVLEDGTPADPNDVAPDDKGVLRHKTGAAVALGPHGPKSTGVDVEEVAKRSRKVEPKSTETPTDEPPSVEVKESAAPKDREMKAGRPKKYKTR